MIAHYRNFLSDRTESGDSSSCDTDLLAEISHVKGVLQDIAPDAETMLDVLRALKATEGCLPTGYKVVSASIDFASVNSILRTLIFVHQTSEDIH